MIFFHHIPKTAGTTINEAVARVNESKCLIIGKEGVAALRDSDVSNYEFIGGHVPFHEARPFLKGGETHVAVLRDPLLRIISYFEMAYRDNGVFRDEICGIDKWGFGFDVFYDRFIVKAGLVNLCCWYFSKTKYFYDSVVEIEKNFSMICDVSTLSFFQRHLSSFISDNSNLNVPTEYPEQNVSRKNEAIIDKINYETIRKIKEDNKEDFLLHRWLMDRHSGSYLK